MHLMHKALLPSLDNLQDFLRYRLAFLYYFNFISLYFSFYFILIFVFILFYFGFFLFILVRPDSRTHRSRR